ncbi:MAG: lysostaphin resistance A-like protein, partial [Candidatus Limnocylindrales bacterium]
SWSAMGVHRPDGRAIAELVTGALWAAPVIVATLPVAWLVTQLVPVTPTSPLPPTGETVGLAINLLAGAIVAPIGEELLFRGFATTAWAREIGERRGLVRAALFFAAVHVLTISGESAGSALGLALVAFATRVPVALALGWLFVRRRTIWAPIGLHAAFNAILLLIAEWALQTPVRPG